MIYSGQISLVHTVPPYIYLFGTLKFTPVQLLDAEVTEALILTHHCDLALWTERIRAPIPVDVYFGNWHWNAVGRRQKQIKDDFRYLSAGCLIHSLPFVICILETSNIFHVIYTSKDTIEGNHMREK